MAAFKSRLSLTRDTRLIQKEVMMEEVEVGNEKGEVVSVSKRQKEQLLTAVGRKTAEGMKYIMCMAEEGAGQAELAGMKYIMCMAPEAELAQRAGMKYIMCKATEEAELAQRAGMKYIMCKAE
ncbi:MAG TPA: hypothetical protein VHI98_04105 [Vicinamibacterales bacterium]|nr:hypothetical protein [Vicinamibacterales bacterium]